MVNWKIMFPPQNYQAAPARHLAPGLPK